jgi:hypothetical protein
MRSRRPAAGRGRSGLWRSRVVATPPRDSVAHRVESCPTAWPRRDERSRPTRTGSCGQVHQSRAARSPDRGPPRAGGASRWARARLGSGSRSPAANQAEGGGRRRRALRQRPGDGFPRVRGRPGKTPRKACCGRTSEDSADGPIRLPAESRSAGFAPQVVVDPVLLDRLVACHGSVIRACFDGQRGDRVGVVRPVVRVTPSLPERPGAKPSSRGSGVRGRSRPCSGGRRGPMMSPS